MKDTEKIETGKEGESIAVAYLKKTAIVFINQTFVARWEKSILSRKKRTGLFLSEITH